MPSTYCAACGSGLTDPEARFCSTCGAAIVTAPPFPDTESAPEPIEVPDPEVADESEASAPTGDEVARDAATSKFDKPPRRTMTEEQWQYTTWGAVAVGVVAVVALIAVVFGLLSHAEDASAASNERTVVTSTSTTIPTADGPAAAAPVSELLMIEAPRVGYPVWYRVGPTAVIVTLSMSECDRIDGMLRASGEIRNNSPLGQTLDYRISVEMTRPVVGTAVATPEAVVDGLAAGETVEWLAETPATKSVSLRCDIAALTVAPASG